MPRRSSISWPRRRHAVHVESRCARPPDWPRRYSSRPDQNDQSNARDARAGHVASRSALAQASLEGGRGSWPDTRAGPQAGASRTADLDHDVAAVGGEGHQVCPGEVESGRRRPYEPVSRRNTPTPSPTVPAARSRRGTATGGPGTTHRRSPLSPPGRTARRYGSSCRAPTSSGRPGGRSLRAAASCRCRRSCQGRPG